jgi:hypothetical protein
VREHFAEPLRKFCIDCPFAPTLAARRPVLDSDPHHLFQPRRIPPGQEVTEQPNATVVNTLYQWQCKPKSPPTPRHIIEADAVHEMVVRLAKPQPSFKPPPNCQPPGSLTGGRSIGS